MVLVSHMNINRRVAVESIRAVAQLEGVTCFYAGNAFAFPAARAGVPGIHLGDDLLAAVELVDRELGLREEQRGDGGGRKDPMEGEAGGQPG